MSQCVPSLPTWDVDDNPDHNLNPERMKFALRTSSNSISSIVDVPTLDYEVAELTWKNGQIAMHGLAPRRVINKPKSTTSVLTKYAWDKPRAGETLEAIVNQATLLPHRKTQVDVYGEELVPWLDYQSSAIVSGSVSASATMTMDALVPSSNNRAYAPPQFTGAAVGCSTRVGSCSGNPAAHGAGGGGGPAAGREWSNCRGQSVSGSATSFGMETTRQLTIETCERELGVKGFTSSSMGSPKNTSSGKHSTKSSPDENDSVCHRRPPAVDSEEKKKVKGKSSISTKRSRAAAIHNQSERKRRDKINERIKTLQKLVPNANKTDKASMLDEVIEYLKQLQAQIHMMSRMNMSPMMIPLAMQQQLQMAMMNPMAMSMGMGMPGVMDFNAIGSRHGMSPIFHPSTFMQPTMASWDMHTASDRVANPNDPMVAFLACQSQPMTMDAYSKMAALYQHMQNQPPAAGLNH